MKQPLLQEPLEQSLPPPQLLPSATLDQALVDALGVHTRQTLAGLTVPDA
jgi:hypothetical protein